MAAVAARAGAARTGLRRLFSVSVFAPPPPPTARPAAEPCNNLFVSGLNKRTTSDGLKEAFSKFGQVTEARVITDRISGYSRGFGFVKYATVEEAGEGIKGMDGKNVVVSIAKVEDAYKCENETKAIIKVEVQLLSFDELLDDMDIAKYGDENRLLPAMNKP